MTQRPVIFVGPSLERTAIAQRLPRARLEPPVARGDLDRLRTEGHTAFLIIDGAFAHTLAIAPSEVVRALHEGALVLGAASIGAIRAAECWPAGIEGVGAVYTLYRLKVIRDDDEVAVATDPDSGFAAVSDALINIRYAILKAIKTGDLTRDHAAAVLAAAKRTHFSQRLWQRAFSDANVNVTPALRKLFDATDVKRRDAARAVEQIAHRIPPEIPPRRPGPPRRPDGRYPGHDPYLGYEPATLRRELTTSLIDTGRYRRYLEQPDADRLWEELERTGALEPELMRWYAIQRIGGDVASATFAR